MLHDTTLARQQTCTWPTYLHIWTGKDADRQCLLFTRKQNSVFDCNYFFATPLTVFGEWRSGLRMCDVFFINLYSKFIFMDRFHSVLHYYKQVPKFLHSSQSLVIFWSNDLCTVKLKKTWVKYVSYSTPWLWIIFYIPPHAQRTHDPVSCFHCVGM